MPPAAFLLEYIFDSLDIFYQISCLYMSCEQLMRRQDQATEKLLVIPTVTPTGFLELSRNTWTHTTTHLPEHLVAK
jgi:hypothetical protein